MNDGFKERIREYAQKLGFTLAGFIKPGKAISYPKFLRWIEADRHAGMEYLARPDAIYKRSDTSLVFGETGTIIVLAYPIPSSISKDFNTPPVGHGRVAAYAWGRDYHDVIPAKTAKLAERISELAGRPIKSKTYTDTGPILERGLAAQAGLGWIGKNSCLIHPQIGSFFLLASMHLDLDLAPDEQTIHDHCGSCTRCIQACPTQCILPDRTLDAAKCISYLTIENKEMIPSELTSGLALNVFGCDICQVVCPWNIRFADQTIDRDLIPDEPTRSLDLAALSRITPQEFNKKFKYSPIKRAKRRGMIRNAIANLSPDPSHRKLISLSLDDDDALVRSSACQALGMEFI